MLAARTYRVLAAAALGVSLWQFVRTKPPDDLPLVRLDVDLGADVSLTTFGISHSNVTSVAISPDAGRVVYVSASPSRLFMRRLDQATASPLEGTDGGDRRFFHRMAGGSDLPSATYCINSLSKAARRPGWGTLSPLAAQAGRTMAV